jgi:hypothetical protein
MDGSLLECDVLAFGSVQLTPQDLALSRQNLNPPEGIKLAPGFLKHAEEQTLAALAAVFQAIKNNALEAQSFSDWYVIGAPRYIGRFAVAGALEKFKAEGAWGVSPHLIPHRSLHSISGSISQALKIHGPNLGVGGGQSAADEGLMLSISLLAKPMAPGAWAVMTGWNPEPDVTLPLAEQDLMCNALALALVPASADFQGWRLGLRPHGTVGYATESTKSCSRVKPLRLEQVQAVLGTPTTGKFTAVWPLISNGYMTLERMIPAPAKMDDMETHRHNGAGTNGVAKKIGTASEVKS